MTKREISALVNQLYSLKRKMDCDKGTYNELRSKLAKHFEVNNLDELRVSDSIGDENDIVAKKQERITSLIYNMDVLKEKLGKDTFNDVVNKTYEVVDIDSLVELLKKAGIKPAEFKKCIKVHEEVDKARIQHLFSIGDITTEQINGTYTATISKSIRIYAARRESGGGRN